MFLLPFHVVGLSHAANSAERVGRLRLSPERTDALLVALRARASSAVLLSTCHRTELYWWGDEELSEWFVTEVIGDTADTGDTGDAGDTDDAACDTGVANVRIDRADADLAVRHLFSVASGMQSARYGEPEILGQVRRAWTASREAGIACGPIDALFRQSIDAARHIRSAMGSNGDPTLGDRVAECMVLHGRARTESPAGEPQAPLRILVVGSGDAARSTLEALRERSAGGRVGSGAALPAMHIEVTSRTDERAAAIAERFDVTALPWAERDVAMMAADVVIFAVHVTSPLVSRMYADVMASRERRALWIDLGVPGAVQAEFLSPLVDLVPLDAIAGAEAPLLQRERTRRASGALQHELDRYARATHRLQLGARLGALEERAVAAAIAHGGASAEGVARRVTRLVLRELTRA